MGDRIQGLHHITLCTGSAQGDIDFFIKTLGLRMVKQTLLYDGGEPIYHLYFVSDLDSPGGITTAFPMRRTGRVGRPGAGQISTTNYSVPVGSLEFWQEHLHKKGVQLLGIHERFGEKLLRFRHSDCALQFELVEVEDDPRKPYAESPYVPAEYGIRGFHSWTVSSRDHEDMAAFLREGWNHKPIGTDGKYVRYAVGNGGPARLVDLEIDPDRRPGSWAYGEGTVHHGAFEVPDAETQARVKFEVEGMGFTDVSDRKHRGYFESVYVRTPAGALFEAAFSVGFTVDEAVDKLGSELKVSPQFEATKDEIIAQMNDPFTL